LALEKLGAVFNQVSAQLKFTPRKFAIDVENNNLIVIETDHNSYTDETKKTRKETMAKVRWEENNIYNIKLVNYNN